MHMLLMQSNAVVHFFPEPHFEQLAPPQSMSLSPWFCTPSEQVAAWQMFPVQTPELQSEGTMQVAPIGHGEQFMPPQSMSLSPWFFSLSAQVATQTKAMQTPLLQSAPFLQTLPLEHFAGGLSAVQVGPPQSVSVSSWFFAMSEHVGAEHVMPPSPAPQTFSLQSLPVLHFLPISQPGHLAPPQSMSLSPWFCTPSEQVGAAQSFRLSQTPSLQSVPVTHFCP